MSANNSSLLARLLDTGEFSDFVLLCQGKEFRLHKAIVCPQSSVMKAALDGGFQEAQTGTLKADSFDISTVQRMVKFLYSGSYDVKFPEAASANPAGALFGVTSKPSSSLSTGSLFPNPSSTFPFGGNKPVKWCGFKVENTPVVDTSELPAYKPDTEPVVPSKEPLLITTEMATLLCHVRMNAIGNYYDIPPLLKLANRYIESIFRQNWSADSFSDVVIDALKRTGDESLHTIMSTTASDHISELVQSNNFARLKSDGDFMYKVLKNCGNRIRQLDESVQNLTTISTMSEANANKAPTIIAAIDQCLNNLKQTRNCRNCNHYFSCYIQNTGSGLDPVYTLRCADCECRHV
ncbi:hypothetical protein BGZ61DRAFT_107493 [Ilyonectria robusta]|uniref:uncharacterized protein n=1 Tax=Ilyonectria robusta TaxID=1079257 RepID=UPI001E8CEE1C|nr:uncharacterized protein BGZ61DRAFT_107493 [Ilyonectria robusta]KAH8670530.1 hypothetical protein BGZ61DRAFT_107493 [Ilyonectria robusta]